MFLSEIIGILFCGVVYAYCARVAFTEISANHKFTLGAEFTCMLITYSLMGGIIIINIILSNVFGFGIISSYHVSFEITLQERIMRL